MLPDGNGSQGAEHYTSHPRRHSPMILFPPSRFNLQIPKPQVSAVLENFWDPIEMGVDARFEATDATSPLLNVTLSASQNLYTRRGTLVGVGGRPDNVRTPLDQPSRGRSHPR